MFRAGHHEEFGSRLEPVDPLYGLFHIDDLVFVALHNQKRAARMVIEVAREPVDSRGNGDEPVRTRRYRGTHRDRRAESKTGDPQGAVRPTGPKPVDRGKRVVEFADAFVVRALAFLRAAKVEPQRAKAEAHE